MATAWLVKSSGRVLGPFDSEKIIELLRTREVSVLDEISSPMRRWQTIQYHESFKDVVETLRRANVSDKTEATWTPGTMTSNLTQTLTDTGGDELTEEITSSLSGFTNTAKEIVIHNVNEQQHQSPGAQAAGRFSAAQAQNAAIQRQVEKTTRGLWVFTMIVLLGVAGFIVNKQFNRGGSIAMNLQSLKAAVFADMQTGQYADALRELKAFFPDPSQAGDLAIVYGSLLVQVENQTVLGRRLLNMVVAQRKPEAKEAYASLGIADLLDNQLDAAQENFNKSLALDGNYTPAIANSAVVALQRGDYARAKALALRSLQNSPQIGEAIITLAQAQLYLFKSNQNTADLNHVLKIMKDFRARSWDYANEFSFYSLYFDFLKQDRGVDERLRDFLDTDPDLTQDHRHNVFVYKGHVQWNVLARLCEQMAEKMGGNPRVAAMLASCYAHEGRLDQSRRAIERAVQQDPKDPLVQAWFSYILRESSESNQAVVVLGSALDANRTNILPVLLQARFCQNNGDVECARDQWQRIYERNLDYLPAVAGLAWVNARKGNRNEAVKLIDKGIRISPDYIPLLQLRLKAEREGWHAAG